MNRTKAARRCAAILAGLLLVGTALAQTPALVPLPASIRAEPGRLTVRDGATISVPAGDAGAATAARLLAERVQVTRGLTLTAGGDAATIRLVRDSAIEGAEAYRLTVARDGIRIAASGDSGLLYGAMTAAQLLAPDRAFGRPVTLSAMTIEDAPRFRWRGLMVDPVRHFQPIEELRLIVDQMAAVKLNRLHLHLTDDQGWRFEVKRYPKLTEVGAWRTGPSVGGGIPPETRVGGFYTQDQLRALVAYAAERGITIVPEIDLPGHATALVAAYPEHGVVGDRPPVSNEWGVMPYLLNPRPESVQFVKDILDELMDVFPGEYIHLGGDEAHKAQWERSPQVQAQIRELGVEGEHGLQTWLIEQLGAHLASKGRRLIGWDEILEGGIPQDASIMSWRGERGAVAAASAGHDVVLSPAPTLYLDSLQSRRADEPPGRIVDGEAGWLRNVYAYDPVPAEIPEDRRHHVLGAQGNAWSEYLVTPWQVQHALFPRAAAIAEITWSRKEDRDYAGFVRRLDPQIARWERGGVHVADSAFAVGTELQGSRGDALRTGRMTLALSSQSPGADLRYTTDGSDPTARSRAYAAPFAVPVGTRVRAVAFDDGHATAAVRDFDGSRDALLTRTSSEMAACPGQRLGLRVQQLPGARANAPTYNINVYDSCFVYPAAPLDVAGGFSVDVTRLAWHYGLAGDYRMQRRHYNATTHGELVVTAGCPTQARPGEPEPPRPPAVAVFALPDPATAPQRVRFDGTLPAGTGDQDLCFQFTAPLGQYFYAVDRVTLKDRAQ